MKSILKQNLFAILILFGSRALLAEEMLNGAGATFPYPFYSACAFHYEKETGARVNYQSIGSGGGVRQVSSRTVDFGASDDAMESKDIEKNGLLQWPQVIGGIVLVVNIPGIKSGEMILDGETIGKIYLGEITNWNDPSLAGLNPGLKLPDQKIIVVQRSDGSGTTAVFTHYLEEVSIGWKSRVGSGKSVKWPTGIGGKGNEGVANYVKRVRNSIGFVEFAYAKQNRLPHTLLKNTTGSIVSPSLETFANAAAAGEYNASKHFYTWITNTKGANAWPISAATNILIPREKMEQNKRVVKFFDWVFSEKGNQKARELSYAPLPETLKKKIRDYWRMHGL